MAALRPLDRRARYPAAVLVGLAALAAAWAISQAPVASTVVVAAAVGAAFIVTRLTVATSILVASFYFEGYLTEGYGVVTPTKLVGALAVVTFVVTWATRRRPVKMVPHLWFIAGLGLSLLISFSIAHHSAPAILVSSRYAMFFVLFFLLVQTEPGREQVEQLIDVVIAASAVAAMLGLQTFFGGNVDRASGPLEDPNDFAFLLASSVPLALYRFRRASTLRRIVLALAVLTIFAAILASFSRAALAGLMIAAIWSLLTNRLNLRWGIIACAGLFLAGGLTYLFRPELVETALSHKQNIAQENVESRLQFWDVAVDQFQSSPLIGVGPGNFQARYSEFDFPPGAQAYTTHNAYLNVLAELGTFGAIMFVGFLVLSWASLRRRFPEQPETDRLMAALAAGFVVALVGALFMTEQFYPPIWFLGALGAILRPASARHELAARAPSNGGTALSQP
jgi:O-antigen ligase